MRKSAIILGAGIAGVIGLLVVTSDRKPIAGRGKNVESVEHALALKMPYDVYLTEAGNLYHPPGTFSTESIVNPPSWLVDSVQESMQTWDERRHALLVTLNGEPPTPEVEAALYGGPFYWAIMPDAGGYRLNSYNRYGYVPRGIGVSVFSTALAVTSLALPLVPGIGPAANAALQGAIALAQGKSLKDAAMIATRSSLPPWGQVAFDLGVGMAEGAPVDQAALNAGLGQLEQRYPGAKLAYAEGKHLAEEYL